MSWSKKSCLIAIKLCHELLQTGILSKKEGRTFPKTSFQQLGNCFVSRGVGASSQKALGT